MKKKKQKPLEIKGVTANNAVWLWVSVFAGVKNITEMTSYHRTRRQNQWKNEPLSPRYPWWGRPPVMGTFFPPPTKIKTELLLPFIWLSFLTASRGARTLKLAEAVRGYWTAWVTAHCQPATWFLFPRGLEMKLFLRSVGCLIDKAYGIRTRLMYSLSFIMSTRADSYLLFLLYLYLMFRWKVYFITLSSSFFAPSLTFTWATACRWWYLILQPTPSTYSVILFSITCSQ